MQTDGLFLLGSVHRHFSLDHQEFSLLCSNGWRWCHRDILVPHWPSSPVTCGSSAHLFDAFFRKVPLLLYLCLECAVLSFLCCCCSVWSCPSCKIGAVEPQHGRLGGGVGGTHTLLFFDFFLFWFVFPLGVWLSQLVWLTSLVTKSFVLKRRGKNKYDFWRHRCRSST